MITYVYIIFIYIYTWYNCSLLTVFFPNWVILQKDFEGTMLTPRFFHCGKLTCRHSMNGTRILPEFMGVFVENGCISNIGVSKTRGTLKWMVKIMETPLKMDDLGVPLFLETSILVSFHLGWFFPTDHDYGRYRVVLDCQLANFPWTSEHRNVKFIGLCGLNPPRNEVRIDVKIRNR